LLIFIAYHRYILESTPRTQKNSSNYAVLSAQLKLTLVIQALGKQNKARNSGLGLGKISVESGHGADF
jgi:hypothetical protein